MGRLIEALWDCNFCGAKQNKGSSRECPNCGRPREPGTQFYLPSQINYVPEEQAEKINRNPDWVCPFCDSLNSDSDSICTSCGSERTSENLDYFSYKNNKTENILSNEKEEKNFEEDNNLLTTSYDKPPNQSKRSFKMNLNTKRNCKIAVSSLLILALLAGLIFLFAPKTEEITITEFNWERLIYIEKYQTVKESSWTLPNDARLLYSELEISHYISVIDHYETRTRQVSKQRLVGYEDYVSGYRDLGNGYFEEIIAQRPIYETYYETESYEEPVYVKQPVYQTKYYYEIDKWLHERTVMSNGADKNPYWEEVTLSDNERISSKAENYYIIGTNSKNKSRQIELAYKEWIVLEIGETVELKVSLFGFGKVLKE